MGVVVGEEDKGGWEEGRKMRDRAMRNRRRVKKDRREGGREGERRVTAWSGRDGHGRIEDGIPSMNAPVMVKTVDVGCSGVNNTSELVTTITRGKGTPYYVLARGRHDQVSSRCIQRLHT